MKTRVYLIEGKRNDQPSFFHGLIKKGFLVESYPNGNAALQRLGEEQPHITIVDGASMRTSGKRICMAIRESHPFLPIVLILDDDNVPQGKVPADVVLVLPFTVQKLVNRMRPFIPVPQKDTILVGDIELDAKHRMVYCEGRQGRLTPHLVLLLKAFLEKPGEVIGREELFSKVWETSYTGDTRTLDVHVSWLRKILEADPRSPKYLITIRNKGYRLDTGDPNELRRDN
jgi:DNA-binding response OmpR family regulator